MVVGIFKRCSMCRAWKLTADFSPDKSSSDGLSWYCHPCGNAYRQGIRHNPTRRPQTIREIVREMYGAIPKYLGPDGKICGICGKRKMNIEFESGEDDCRYCRRIRKGMICQTSDK